ncbi:FkbM family methyltransferase [bacterium]|nr:FkbM family methyltransferase [bacterium]
MSLVRRMFYSEKGNTLIRGLIGPLKSGIPQSARFPVSGVIETDIPGHRALRLSVNPTCFIGKVLYWEGLQGFEPGVHRVFRHFVKQSTTFLDIGANVGFYSAMAAVYSPSTTVHAFEPLPAAFTYLKENLRLNQASNAIAHQIALSDASGETSFFFALNPKFDFVENQLTSTGSLDQDQAARTAQVKEIKVTLSTLDDFVSKQKIDQIDLIKMDTEATEHLVLDGARETISRFRPIILCEVLPGKVESEIQARIEALNYVAYQISPHGVRQTTSLKHAKSSENDFVFCPEEKTGLMDSLQRG